MKFRLFSTTNQVDSAPDRVVGIDVGSAAIKVVELEYSTAGPIVKTYGEIQLGPYALKALGEPVDLERQQAVEAFTDLLRESGVQAEQSVLAMPLMSGFVTIVPMLVHAEEEMSNRVIAEAPKYIPVPLEDVTLDWIALDTATETKQQEILLVAMQNEAIAQNTEMLQAVGLPSQPIELEIFSAIRGAGASAEETCAIIDIGASTSKLYIVRKGILVRIHRVQAGGAAITEKLAAMFDCSFVEAENIKRSDTQSTDQKKDCAHAMTTVLQSSLQEFKRVIDQYETDFADGLSRVVLTGGVATSADIATYVSDVLGRQVSAATPFVGVGYPTVLEERVRTIGPTFTNSIGAALRQYQN